MLVASVIVAGLALGVTLASGSAGGGFAKARFPEYGFSLRYPRGWARLSWCPSLTLHAFPIAVLTTAQPPPSCTEAAPGVAVSFPPPEALGMNGVSLELAVVVSPPSPPSAKTKPKWNARIVGRPAWVERPVYGRQDDSAITCPAGVRREYRAVGVRSSRDGTLWLDSVICGPNLAVREKALRRILASLRFTR